MDLDPAAVLRQHLGLHTCSALVWHPDREGRNGERCLPYRLAEALEQARAGLRAEQVVSRQLAHALQQTQDDLAHQTA